eukprot:1159183-Pelagomonas_calceolata.AAC.22
MPNIARQCLTDTAICWKDCKTNTEGKPYISAHRGQNKLLPTCSHSWFGQALRAACSAPATAVFLNTASALCRLQPELGRTWAAVTSSKAAARTTAASARLNCACSHRCALAMTFVLDHNPESGGWWPLMGGDAAPHRCALVTTFSRDRRSESEGGMMAALAGLNFAIVMQKKMSVMVQMMQLQSHWCTFCDGFHQRSPA